MDETIRDYLNTVTSGLKDDAELRLDVQAELAGHLEDKASELERGGLAAPAAQAEAVKALGEVAEVAAGLERGNRVRLNRRAWLRRGLRFALVPAAVVAAILSVDLQWAVALDNLGRFPGVIRPPAAWLVALGGGKARLWPEHPLLTSSPRELWESDRGSRIFYGEYVTHDVVQNAGSDARTAEQRQALLETLETARTLDPGNARYDYLRAAVLLAGACTVTAEPGEKGPDDKAGPRRLAWEVADRARLDQAMGHLLAGLAKPSFRRYGRDMLMLKLEALGPAERLSHHLRRIVVSASALLPDLSRLRELSRVASLYGDLLAGEGRIAEARPYLDAWKTLTVHLNADTWTLIDCLVVSALATDAAEHSARVYERLGLADDAARTRREAALLAGPVKAWREHRNDPALKALEAAHEEEMRLYGGILASVLLPALDEWPAPEAYAASRRLEYAVAMQGGLSLLSGLLLLAMLTCLVISLRWRLMSGGEVIPILLLPEAGVTARFLGYGVLLPLGVFAAVVLWVPISGQCYSARAGLHKVLAELLLLATAILVVPACLAVRSARRRCRDLGIDGGVTASRWGLVPLLAASVAVAAVWWIPARASGPSTVGLAVVAGAALVLVLTAAVAALRLLLAPRAAGLSCGTVARSLIPIFAAAVILLSAIGRPALRQAERVNLAADTLMLTPPGEVGFSPVENRLTERLQKAVAAAAATLAER